MRPVVLALLVASGASGASGACGNGSSGDPKAGPGAVAGIPQDLVIDAWKVGGLAPSVFAAATVPVGTDCKSGTVNGVDALICAYPTAEAAKAAEPAAYDWVGNLTGTVLIRGSLVIAAADRRKADPSGRTINQLMKLAPK